MHRIEGIENIRVMNLKTGAMLTYVGITPALAVVSAHAMSLGMNIRNAEKKFASQCKTAGRTVSCGDYAALTEEGKKALLERKSKRAEDIFEQTGEPVVYDYGSDIFRRDVLEDIHEVATPTVGR